jgi:hypothetical protein
MTDNAGDITDGNVLPISARYEAIIDAQNRMWDSVPRDADGNKWAPVCDDEMPSYLGKILGWTITAAELQAAQRWQWEQIAGGKIIPAPARVAEVAVQIDDYQCALKRLTKCLVQLFDHPAIATVMTRNDKYNNDLYCLHTLGELETKTEQMLEFAHQAPAALHVMRGSLEGAPFAHDLVMDEATRTAYRAVIEALDRTQAALGIPLSGRSRFFEVKRGAVPLPDAESELKRLDDNDLHAALTDARILCQGIEAEIGRRATASARALAAMFIQAREPHDDPPPAA